MKNRFKFSIIMSVYNVESYIDEAVESVLNQTIGFADNVQIVFVNDGSTDNSGQICAKYQTAYPDNIVYIEQKNKGLSAARNAGLEVALGSYINFFDPDDVLSSNVLEEVALFFEVNGLAIDFATIPLVYFEAQKGLHAKYKPLGKVNRVINLLDVPCGFVLSSAGSFYKASVFESLRYDESLVNFEDARVNLQLMKANPQFGYVCEKGVKYHYRRRFAGGSNVDKFKQGDYSSLTSTLDVLDGLYAQSSKLLEYQMEFVAYAIRPLLQNLTRAAFSDESSYESILKRCSYWAKMLDDDFIIRRSRYLDSNERKNLFLRLKGESFASLWRSGGIDSSRFRVRIKDICVLEQYVVLDLLFNTFGCPFDLAVYSAEGERINPVESKDFHSSFDISYGEFEEDITHYRQFKLPLNQRWYSFYFIDFEQGILTLPSAVIPSHKPPLMSLGQDLGIRRFGKHICIRNKQLIIDDDCSTSAVHGFKTMRSIKRNSKVLAALRPLAQDEKKYILISDRPNKAGDNGQALFEYIMKHGSKKLRSITYYVLDKQSDSYKTLQCKKHVVQPRSLKHKLLFLNSRMVFSSHNARKFYMPFAHNGKYYADQLNYQFVWLQHGITQNDISKQANRLQTEDDYIITASGRERDEFLRDAYFYKPEQIVLTGFPRYDKLRSDSKKVITVAPTWRSGLSGPIQKDGFHAPIPGFEKSNYFTQFSGLLKSPAFLRLLNEYGYSCRFVCHPGFACYEHFFKQCESENVKVVPQAEVDYSSLFADSSIFITDFSSTAFDFAYLRKPVIYYQFDELEQYDPGYFSYERDGFGPVARSTEELLSYISKLVANHSEIEDLYLERVNGFFQYKDSNNCRRILEATLPKDLLL